MSDGEHPDRNDFQQRLQQLIDEHSDVPGMSSGYLLIRVSQDMEMLDAGEAMYAYNYRPGQNIHVTRGLVEMARTNFDQRCRTDTDYDR